MADGRRLGFSLFQGAQVAIDTTMVSAVRAAEHRGPVQPGKEALPWMTRGHGKRSRIRSLSARAVVPSLSFSRRKEADVGPAQFIHALAASKAISALEFMQASVAHAWCHRWRRLWGVPRRKPSLALHRSLDSAAGVVPSVHDVIRDGLHEMKVLQKKKSARTWTLLAETPPQALDKQKPTKEIFCAYQCDS